MSANASAEVVPTSAPAAASRPATTPTTKVSLTARLLMTPIRGWRLVSRHLPPRCRFHPSCSQYALDALATHGAGRGSWLATKRVARCHPWHDGGVDHVPPRAGSTTTGPNVRSFEHRSAPVPARGSSHDV